MQNQCYLNLISAHCRVKDDRSLIIGAFTVCRTSDTCVSPVVIKMLYRLLWLYIQFYINERYRTVKQMQSSPDRK